ncbi:TadE/TadG family type IV pilus assembly protein [Sphingomonas desiccabilis]|uniref:Pilus assembly protein n=1 Tax=Sphingomonas desiccabilis TaxID=429134 RepID=A0A4Q2J1C8_9SPHN|nr:TadE/TadG family type IV pilus assembly protein [Sphingomonas desiccabilis]MBB3910892.1 Flp pilus assembly protein TadG [Sphingomonas desiccabilis]RXZ35490.1 pilus assembly protein [Sphingomonas desiccabilis]
MAGDPTCRTLARRLAHDRQGATIVEFALVAPVLAVLLMGAFDIGHGLYVNAALQGIVQKTARDSALEGGTSTATAAALDKQVADQVRVLARNAQVSISRRFYRNYAAAAAKKAENFTDTNKNGTCDKGEPYEDANLNGTWDPDGGNAGQGGAKDATVYTATVSYTRLFPFWPLVGGSPRARVSATTVLRNQPYGDQGSYGAAVVRNCA